MATNLTDEMVLKLSVFGTSTKLWLNLNQKYIEKKLEIEKRIQIIKNVSLRRNLIINSGLGLVKATRATTEKVQKLKDTSKYLHLVYLAEIFLFVSTSASEVTT